MPLFRPNGVVPFRNTGYWTTIVSVTRLTGRVVRYSSRLRAGGGGEQPFLVNRFRVPRSTTDRFLCHIYLSVQRRVLLHVCNNNNDNLYLHSKWYILYTYIRYMLLKNGFLCIKRNQNKQYNTKLKNQ